MKKENKEENAFELLDSNLLYSLKNWNNTIINTETFESKLYYIFNEYKKHKISYNKFKKIDLDVRIRLVEEYKRRLEELVGKKVEFVHLPATDPSTVDCILIKAVK